MSQRELGRDNCLRSPQAAGDSRVREAADRSTFSGLGERSTHHVYR